MFVGQTVHFNKLNVSSHDPHLLVMCALNVSDRHSQLGLRKLAQNVKKALQFLSCTARIQFRVLGAPRARPVLLFTELYIIMGSSSVAIETAPNMAD